jgi:hypothetical protein
VTLSKRHTLSTNCTIPILLTSMVLYRQVWLSHISDFVLFLFDCHLVLVSPPYLVLELMENGALDLFLIQFRNQRPLHVLIRYIGDVVAGMVYLSNRKFIHRVRLCVCVCLSVSVCHMAGDNH